MKKLATIGVPFLLSIVLLVNASLKSDAAFQEVRKPQDVYILGPEAKLGGVKFNHLDHSTKAQGPDGKQIACVDCHHTAQPAAEAAKHPPLKTVFPADRTTTLTADLLEKDPTAPPVNGCRDCHARADTKPKILADIPKLPLEGSAESGVLNNQQALHRNCASCHDEVAKTKQTTAPTSKKCVACHKKNQA